MVQNVGIFNFFTNQGVSMKVKAFDGDLMMDPEVLKEQRVREAELIAKKELKRKQAAARDSGGIKENKRKLPDNLHLHLGQHML